MFELESFCTNRKNKRFPRKLLLLKSCTSTNEIALQEALKGAPDGTVIVAEHQTNGKGRLGRSWFSWPGNLALSVILRPKIDFKDAHRLLNASTLATLKALTFFGIPALVKWPNDILIKSHNNKKVLKLGPYRKIGGILLELSSFEDSIDAAIIGVGLNLCRPPNDFDIKTIPQMGYIEDTSNEVDLHLLIDKFLDELESTLSCIKVAADYETLLDEIKSHSCLLGNEVRVECGEKTIEGIARDIASDGALIIDCHQTGAHKVYYGDVHLI